MQLRSYKTIMWWIYSFSTDIKNVKSESDKLNSWHLKENLETGSIQKQFCAFVGDSLS